MGMWEKWKVCRLLVGKPERKRPLGRPRHRRVGDIKINFVEKVWDFLTGFVWLRIETSGEL
jgi:hypothetical protein